MSQEFGSQEFGSQEFGSEGLGSEELARAHPANRHAGPLVALGLALALMVGAVVVAIVGGDDVGPTAVSVNGTEIARSSFEDDLHGLAPVLEAGQADANAVVTATDAYVPSEAAAQLATLYVTANLLDDEVSRRGMEVSAVDRKEFVDSNRAGLRGYSSNLRKLIVDNAMAFTALVDELGEDRARTVVGRVARRADVHVDPRYGSWNRARAEVCPPMGCAAPPSPAG